MTTIKISALSDARSIEGFYGSLSKRDVDIVFSKDLPTVLPGLLAKEVQLIITAAQTASLLVSGIESKEKVEEDDISSVVDSPVGVSAILMSGDFYVKDQRGRELIKKKLAARGSLLQQRFDASYGAHGKRMMQFIAIDHSVDKYRFPRAFYEEIDGSKRVKGYSGFSVIFRAFQQQFMREGRLDAGEIRALSCILQELIKNTHDHAIRSDGSRSIRGCVLRHHQANASTNKAMGAGDSIEADYIKRAFASAEGRPLNLMEMSVFDSGFGLYRTYKKAESYPEEVKDEYEVVMECFEKHKTSKTYGEGYGEGLYQALRVVKERKGLVTLRTGRLSLFRDFSADEDAGEDWKLMDVAKTGDELVKRQPVSGAAFTVLMPVGRK